MDAEFLHLVVDAFGFAKVLDGSDPYAEIALVVDIHRRYFHRPDVRLLKPVTQLDGIVPDTEAADLQEDAARRIPRSIGAGFGAADR